MKTRINKYSLIPAAVAALGFAFGAATAAFAQTDVTQPGDPIQLVDGVDDGDGVAGPPPAAEGVERAIDNVGQKYLNFLDLGSGLAVQPSVGLTIVTGLRFYPANDAEERDPSSYVLEGSTTGLGGPWASIASGPLALPSTRNPSGSTPLVGLAWQEVTFPNSTAYNAYRLTFPTLKNAAAANSMQIAEVEFLGTPVVPPLRVLSVAVRACSDHEVVVTFDKPVALTGNYALIGSLQVVNSWQYGATHSEVVVDTEPLTPDTPFLLRIAGETGEDGSVLAPEPTDVSFSYGYGRFCADFEDGQLPAGTFSTGATPPAVGPGAGGAGLVLHLTDQVNSQQNHWTIPLPATRTLDRLQARWKTLLGGPVGGSADGFSFNAGVGGAGVAMAYVGGVEEEGADNGLSVTVDTYDNGGGEVGLEVRWNGARLAFTPVGGGGTGPAELMRNQFVDASVELTPSGLVTFQYDTFVVSAQIPGFTGLTLNRYEFGARTGGANENCWIDDLCINAFSLTPPASLSGPNDQTVIAATTATFSVSVGDGIPPFTYQWLRDGQPIAGATGPSHSFTATGADNGAKFSVVVANGCGSVTSQEATLTVIIAPVLQNCSSRGNCHAIYLTYNHPVQLDGTYTVLCSNTIPPVGVQFFAEDFNAGTGGFTVDTPIAYDGPWIYSAGSGSWTQAGQGPENNRPNTSTLISPPITVPRAGVVQLTFAHRYSFESGRWDGGQVRISVNGGAFTTVPGAAFSQNGYSGTVLAGSSSLLADQPAFVENSPNFASGPITSTCTLGAFGAGDSIRVAFMAASDTNTRGDFQPNWELDALALGVADPAVTPITVTGVSYGESQNVVCLRVSPDLVPDTQVYSVTAVDVHDLDGVVVNPNPSTCSLVHGAGYPVFRILEKRFDNIGGVTVADLTNSARFPNQPDQVLRDPTGFFEIPTDAADNYGAQILGWAVVPVEGDYRFWVSSDDLSELYIAEDTLPAHKRMVAFEPQWNGSRQFATCDRRTCIGDIPQENQSGPIHLLAGQVIYLEGLIKEGGGGDNFSVAATIDDPNPPANGSSPIAAQFFLPRRLGPNGEIFSTLCDAFCNPGPSDQTVFIGQRATFLAVPDGTPPYTFQWSKNGGPIPGATSATYTTPPASAADDGAVFAVEIRNAFSSASCSAVLHVRPNPIVTACFARCGPNEVTVVYNKPVQLNGTYTLSGGLLVRGVRHGADQNIVLLDTDSLTLDAEYTIEITDVEDQDGNPLFYNPTMCNFCYGFHRYCADFNTGQLPPGTVSSGTTPPYVGPELALHLTDQVNGQANYWTVPLAATQTVPFFQARWKTLLAGPIGGAADGFSFNAGVNVGTGFTPEEGGGNGLSVTVDTYDNGGGEVGAEIRWNGTPLAFLQIGGGGTGPAELMKNQFVDASVEITPGGWVTFKYDTYVLNAQIPGYTVLSVNQYVFAARTGGANENCWIDDLCINSWTPGAAGVVQEPANATILRECLDAATFRVAVEGTPPYSVQWYSNDVLVASVTGAVAQVHTYTTPPLNRAAQGARYKAVIRNECGEATTREAEVLVIGNDPAVLSVVGDWIASRVLVTFSKPMDPVSASNPANYTVNGGALSVLSAQLQPGGRTVELAVSPGLPKTNCTRLVLGAVRDFCAGQTPAGLEVLIQMKGAVLASGPQNLIVVDAEDWDFNRSPGTTNVGGTQGRLDENRWVRSTALPNYLGPAYAEAVPDLTSFGGNTPDEAAFNASPRLDYWVNFPVAGTYYFWARGSTADDGGNNSLHVALDYVSADERGRRVGNRIANWGGDPGNVDAFGWINDANMAPAAIDVPTAGPHVVSILMREDGLRLDRFLLTTDAAFTLAASDIGPDASPREPVGASLALICPANAVSECGYPAVYGLTAMDACGSVATGVIVVCTPPEGTVFRVGTTNITCTAQDAAGTRATCSFTLTTVDTTPPQVFCSTNITVKGTNEAGNIVTYTAGASDACDLQGWNCSPPSGSVFPIGRTAVRCEAVDVAGNAARCTFVVTVRGGAGLAKEECLEALIALRATVTDSLDAQRLDYAIEHWQASLAPELWVDDLHLDRKKGDKVFDEEKKAAHALGEIQADKKSPLPPAGLQGYIDCILRADRLLAVTAVDEAEAAGANPKKIAQDRAEIARGDAEAADGQAEVAISHYRNAWKHAVHVKPVRYAPYPGGFRLEFLGMPSETYVIEASEDLVHWTPLARLRSNADGEIAYDDEQAGQFRTRYYRVTEP